MKISKLIQKLERTMERHGDIQVYKSWEWYEEDMVGTTDEAVNSIKVETRNVSVFDNTKHKVVVVQ